MPHVRHASNRLPGHAAARWVGRTWARLSYGYRTEPTWVEHNEIEVGIRDLPRAFDGFRIAHLSDLHSGHHLPERFLPDVVDRTLALRPDLIALTGDYIHKGYHHVDTVADVLSRLHAPHGVFGVLGNHDFSVRNALGLRFRPNLHRAIASALADRGVRVLRNESVLLHRGTDSIQLAGLDDLWSRECQPVRTLRPLCPHTPRVVLAHNPLTVDHLGGERCDLMLSGHTHGGQIDWPGVGRFLLGKKARRLAAGLYRHDQTNVYVSKGVGYGWRFRYGVRPEIATLVLRPIN
jgi:uncharacterized protein